jgi:Transglycosylase SLT domain.
MNSQIMDPDLLLSIAIEQAAEQFDIPSEVIEAIVQTESAGNIYAYRTERHYQWLVNAQNKKPFRRLTKAEKTSEKAPADFPYIKVISSRNTEFMGQQASWGPMQVMGAVAREYGFKCAFPMLCGIAGIHYGTLHLAKLKKRFFNTHGWGGVFAAYNAGSPRRKNGEYVNQHYVDTIYKKLGNKCLALMQEEVAEDAA